MTFLAKPLVYVKRRQSHSEMKLNTVTTIHKNIAISKPALTRLTA